MASKEIEFEDVSENLTPLEIPEQEQESTEKVTAPKSEKTIEQLQAYKKHFEALQAELAEIDTRYPASSKDSSSELEKRVSGVEKGIEEIKELLQARAQPQPQYPQYQPYPQQFPQMPMFQPSAPMMPPVVTMPYGR